MLVDYNGFDFYLRGISLKFAVGILIMQWRSFAGTTVSNVLNRRDSFEERSFVRKKL